MTDEMWELLKKYVSRHKWCWQRENDPVAAMMSRIACYGGDTTCQLMTHYGPRLREMVAKAMEEV